MKHIFTLFRKISKGSSIDSVTNSCRVQLSFQKISELRYEGTVNHKEDENVELKIFLKPSFDFMTQLLTWFPTSFTHKNFTRNSSHGTSLKISVYLFGLLIVFYLFNDFLSIQIQSRGETLNNIWRWENIWTQSPADLIFLINFRRKFIAVLRQQESYFFRATLLSAEKSPEV